ncbi:hypothetical protein LCGC14_1327160 [marine sediment metagenome]|uniref:Uncharacterized protein n=1 Tax=marine sediment metagenome TaxID=412755 RepID=A0A0F9MYM1_9ZZZZ
MGEYELELVSQHPALTAQNPLSTPLKVLNIMNRGKAPFSSSNQLVTAIRGKSTEHIKEKGSRDNAHRARTAQLASLCYTISMYTPEDAAREAGSAEGNALWRAIKTQFPQALANATYNRKLNDDQAVFIARSKKTPAESLGFLAGDVRFKKNYKVILSLTKNPKTPLRVAIALLKYVKIFDLADLTRNHFVPSVTRQRVQVMINDRLKGMPSGVKIALARRASTDIIIKLMEKSDSMVADACLESPILTEDKLFQVIQRQATKPHVVRAIAGHPKWSLRYRLRYGLIRNTYTPMEAVERFIEGMKSRDLKDLYGDTRVPPSTKPFIHRELLRRDEDTEPVVDEVHELDEHEDRVLGDEEVSGLIEESSRFVDTSGDDPEEEPPYEPDEPDESE